MKILIVTPMFPAHPQDVHYKFIYDSIEALHALGHEIKVLVTQRWLPQWMTIHTSARLIQTHQFPSWLDIKICRFISIPRFYCLSWTMRHYATRITAAIKHIIRTWPCDLIHLHTEKTLAILTKNHAFNLPIVATIHGLETHPRFWRTAQSLISQGLAQINRVILVGQSLQPFFETLAPTQRHFRIVQNGFTAPERLRTQSSSPWQGPMRIISVSNLSDPSKGIDLTLQALATILQRGYTQWTYTIIGSGYHHQTLVALSKQLGLEKKVHFLGAIEHDKLYDHLLQAHIFCLPAYKEAFGIAYLEAMAAGLLAIGVEGQGPSTFITHQQTGLLVKPKNIHTLAECLQHAMRHPDSMQHIAKRGKTYIWENYTWIHHAKQLTAIYQEMV